MAELKVELYNGTCEPTLIAEWVDYFGGFEKAYIVREDDLTIFRKPLIEITPNACQWSWF